MSEHEIGLLLRREIIAPLRNGTVPRRGLEHLAVGLDRHTQALEDTLADVSHGQGHFKAVRGDYGCGKTFFARWVQYRAQQLGFATAEVQISATETPLHKLETIYRRALESLRTKEWGDDAFRKLVERWFYTLEDEVLSEHPDLDGDRLAEAVGSKLEARLGSVRDTQPLFATVLRAAHRARVAEDHATVDGLLAWLMGQPNVGASIKRPVGIQGEIDATTAAGFFRGLLAILKQTGRKGLVLVLDEVEVVQRMRRDLRGESLEALRKLIDDLDHGRFPGMYVMVTGTPSFFDGPMGIRQLGALEQRLAQDFSGDPRFDSARAMQIRLMPFDEAKLVELGRKVRDLYPATHPERIMAKVDDDVLLALARGVSGRFGGKVGTAPRLFVRKLVSELLDKVDEHADYDPKKDFQLVIDAREMTPEERQAAGLEASVDDIELDVAGADPGPSDPRGSR